MKLNSKHNAFNDLELILSRCALKNIPLQIASNDLTKLIKMEVLFLSGFIYIFAKHKPKRPQYSFKQIVLASFVANALRFCKYIKA